MTRLRVTCEPRAVQFYSNDTEGFERENALYRHPQIRETLPPVHGGSSNHDGATRSPSGFVFPPYLILERGVSLSEWLLQPRSSLSVLNMFFDVTKQLVRLHRAGHAHRDLKPGAPFPCPHRGYLPLMSSIAERASTICDSVLVGHWSTLPRAD